MAKRIFHLALQQVSKEQGHESIENNNRVLPVIDQINIIVTTKMIDWLDGPKLSPRYEKNSKIF